MRVGDIVRIKELPGTKLASKRKPVWAVISTVRPLQQIDDEQNHWCTLELLQQVDGPYGIRKRAYLQRRCFDYPTDKQVPDWVWAEVAKRALLGEGDA